MIRKLLVPVRSDGKAPNVLAHAAALAHRHKAHVEVLHCRPRPEDLMPFGVHVPDFLRKQIFEQSHKVADQEEEGLRATLEEVARDLNLDASGASLGKGGSIAFVEEAGRQADVIKRRGRLADLIVVSKPDRDRNIGHNTLKSALFQSGRPVLMCPPRKTPPKDLGGRITIAWNGSAEAARALSLNKAMLRGADKVWVLSNGMDAGPGTTADDMIAYLTLQGLSAELHALPKDLKVGKALLKASVELDADMMIMGAYGDSHERETVFGGNTQTIVDTADMPVLLNH